MRLRQAMHMQRYEEGINAANGGGRDMIIPPPPNSPPPPVPSRNADSELSSNASSMSSSSKGYTPDYENVAGIEPPNSGSGSYQQMNKVD